VLAFLPFEKAFYDKHQAPCRFIGHTMADSIPFDSPKEPARSALGLENRSPVLAVLPGSRTAEVGLLAEPFLKACLLLKSRFPDIQFVIPFVNERRKAQFLELKAQIAPELNITYSNGQARTVMASADVILLASGTATLEAMLVKRPMVVGYKVKPFSYWLAQRLVKIRTFSLPNLLAGEMIVPELIQDDCDPELIADAVGKYLSKDNTTLINKFNQLHALIRKNADVQAANAVIDVIEGNI